MKSSVYYCKLPLCGHLGNVTGWAGNEQNGWLNYLELQIELIYNRNSIILVNKIENASKQSKWCHIKNFLIINVQWQKTDKGKQGHVHTPCSLNRLIHSADKYT